MDKHLLYDWETLSPGGYPDTAVLSIGMIVFDPSEILSFDQLVSNALRIKFDYTEQINRMGRVYDKETIDWWNQPENADAKAKVVDRDGTERSLSDMKSIVDKYLEIMEYDGTKGKVWTRGNDFDSPILVNVYKQFNWEMPYSWWNIRDIRTEIDAITQYWDHNHEGYGYIKDFPYPDGFIKHLETHDCCRDVLMMQYTHSKLQDLIHR